MGSTGIVNLRRILTIEVAFLPNELLYRASRDTTARARL
jgi:hypothetical protein